MSSSQDFAEFGRFSGRRMVRVPEKSSFSQTCSLLSQYLKEKGSFGDLNFGMTCNPDGKGTVDTLNHTTNKMDLSTNAEITGDLSGVSERDQEPVLSPRLKSIDLFPQRAGFGPSEDVPKKAADIRDETRAMAESETAPLTIFYGGQVFVFDNIPAGKAKELMLFASKGLSANNGTFASTQGDEKPNFGGLVSNVASDAGNNSKHEFFQRPPLQANASDLPIARRASLHRFLEKRKDRVIERAPYQLSSSANKVPVKARGTQELAWHGLA